ncbi:MAG: thymidylate synthase, partial [Bacteroidia bacterium]
FAEIWGELGPIYGYQWTKWGKGDDIWEESPAQSGILISKKHPGINQIEELIYTLRNNPDSRRLIVTAWNPSDIPAVILPPCHYCFECDSRLLTIEERENEMKKMGFGIPPSSPLKAEEQFDYYNVPKRMLSLKWTQRSVDTPIGLPYNISSYAFLLSLLAQQTNMVPGELIGSLGNTHIYNNQLEEVEEQLKNETFDLPTLKIKKASSIFDYKYEDFEIINYQSASKVNYKLSN